MSKISERTYTNTIVLAGSGRSGTTWLGNIIAANPNMRVIFEPFDYRRVPQADQMPLRPYARPNGKYPGWESYVAEVLAGKLSNEWINRDGYRWWAWRRLVKDIRANLMLAWIDKKYNPKIVFMIRHPCAVVVSRKKLKWQTHLDVFLAQPELIADYLDPFMDIILAAQTETQKHAVMWCVENLVPLRQIPDYHWNFITYEQLVVDPEMESSRLLASLGVRRTWLTRRAIWKISKVARSDSAIVNHLNPLTEWKNQLPARDIEEVLRITEQFGIKLYNTDPLPNKGLLLIDEISSKR